jgi:hypothetical protein
LRRGGLGWGEFNKKEKKTMYIFSVNARAKKSFDDLKEGQLVPFIVYINFVDLYGAEQLCKIYLMRAGFMDVDIENENWFLVI